MGEHHSLGFLSLNYPYFLILLQILILIDLRVVLEHIFISISMLYNRDSYFINVQTKIEAKI